MSRPHRLKTWPEPFEAVVAGRKRFEYRFDDRGFNVGDRLILEEWKPIAGVTPETIMRASSKARSSEWIGDYTGAAVEAKVEHIERGPEWGIALGYVVMSLSVPIRLSPRRAPRSD